MEAMFNAMANFGFPVVVAVYLLVRIEGKLEQLTISIYKLGENIAEMKNS